MPSYSATYDAAGNVATLTTSFGAIASLMTGGQGNCMFNQPEL